MFFFFFFFQAEDGIRDFCLSRGLGDVYKRQLLENYDDLLNLTVDYIGGDGQTESNITNRLGNPSEYDAFAINMVKTDNASSYTSLLK